jgi:dolichol-phosphate mannosyltransferase
MTVSMHNARVALPAPQNATTLPRVAEFKVAVVIPAYRVRKHILGVIAEIGSEVSRIYVVDDACSENSGSFVARYCLDRRVVVLSNSQNEGVGGAMILGYKQAIADGYDLVVKLDGDGQMDPHLISELVAPILNGSADYTKGNRFCNLNSVLSIPPARLLGNIALSSVTVIGTGYFHLFDTVNGFTAISAKSLKKMALQNISKGYYFETDMLFALSNLNCVVADIRMPSIYRDEKSNLKIYRAIPEFLIGNFRNVYARLRNKFGRHKE